MKVKSLSKTAVVARCFRKIVSYSSRAVTGTVSEIKVIGSDSPAVCELAKPDIRKTSIGHNSALISLTVDHSVKLLACASASVNQLVYYVQMSWDCGPIAWFEDLSSGLCWGPSSWFSMLFSVNILSGIRRYIAEMFWASMQRLRRPPIFVHFSVIFSLQMTWNCNSV